MQIQELIKSYRLNNNLTQQEMADKMHMTKQSYARMEKGQTSMTDNKLNAFAKAIGKNTREIRNAAENDKLVNILQDNTINEIKESESVGLIVNNHYYGDSELNEQIAHLKSLLAEKDKQIALLEALVESLKR